MTARAFFLFLSLFIVFSVVAVPRASAESLDDYKDRMKKEQEEKDEKQRKRHRDDEFENENDDDSSCNIFGACLQVIFDSGCVDACFDTGLELVAAAVAGVRYPEYPFYPDTKRPFARRAKQTPPPAPSAEGEPPPAEPAPAQPAVEQPRWMSKFWIGEVSAAGSYLFGPETAMYDVSGILSLNITVFQVNAFYQFLGDMEGGTLHTVSVNGGIVFPSRYYTASLYAGIFLQQGFDPYVSFGAAGKVFLPGNIIISVYSLFAVYDSFFFVVINPTLELAVNRFTFGLGFNFYDYNNLILYGPTAKIGMWF